MSHDCSIQNWCVSYKLSTCFGKLYLEMEGVSSYLRNRIPTDLVSDKMASMTLLEPTFSAFIPPSGIFRRSIPQLDTCTKPTRQCTLLPGKILSGTARKLLRDPTLSGARTHNGAGGWRRVTREKVGVFSLWNNPTELSPVLRLPWLNSWNILLLFQMHNENHKNYGHCPPHRKFRLMPSNYTSRRYVRNSLDMCFRSIACPTQKWFKYSK